MWAKGAAVGNARRAAPRCPRSRPVRRRRIVHMSTTPAGCAAPGPLGPTHGGGHGSDFSILASCLPQLAEDQILRLLGTPRLDAALQGP